MSSNENTAGFVELVKDMAVMKNDSKHIMATLKRIEDTLSKANADLEARVARIEMFESEVKATVNAYKWVAGLGGGSGFATLAAYLAKVFSA